MGNMSLKRGIKVGISIVYYVSRRLGEMFSSLRGQPRLIILFYHAVRSEHRAAFRWQLEAIKAYANVVHADYVGESEGRPMIAITFDDAFISMVDNALPELAAREMPCTIFVPTRCLGSHPEWLKNSTWCDRDELVADQGKLRSVMSSNVRLGSHTRSHPNLTEIRSHEIEEEISGSKSDIEKLFNAETELIAFPYGIFDEQVLGICKKAGYRFAYSIEEGAVDPRDEKLLRRRVAVEPSDTKIEFWLKIRGGYEWMRLASNLKRRLIGRSSKAAISAT
jgi:peptidoglycan/xylan/chitin deacetylase (PgdA/CDA1 family)